MSSKVLAVIPARLGSTRFPGKMLYSHRGKPLLYYVWHQVQKARTVDRTIIATDSDEIARAAREFGAEVVRTSKRHQTGSDRVAEAAAGSTESIVVNVQGDSFGLRPGLLDKVIAAMKSDRSIKYATLARPIKTDAELFNPNVVKVVVDHAGRTGRTGHAGRALWFSRFPLPYLQQSEQKNRHRQFKFRAHIGLYFFRRPALEQFASWKRTPLEKAESLEQLRILENGGVMTVFGTTARTFSIDTPDDLKKIAL